VALKKAMATHSSTLAWRNPGMAEPGGLQSMGSQRVGHDWSNLAAVAAATNGPIKEVLIFIHKKSCGVWWLRFWVTCLNSINKDPSILLLFHLCYVNGSPLSSWLQRGCHMSKCSRLSIHRLLPVHLNEKERVHEPIQVSHCSEGVH